jgi:hypothetical protein
MKRKKLICSFMVLLTIVILPVSALAKGSASITIKPSEVVVDEHFSVTISFNGSGTKIGTIIAEVTYDPDAIKYVSGGGNDMGVSKGKATISSLDLEAVKSNSYTMTFRALKKGSTSISVVKSEILSSENGSEIGNPTTSAAIDINAEGVAAPEEDEQEDIVDDLIEVSIDGEIYYIWKDLSGIELPVGFVSKEVQYMGIAIEAANRSGITLFYLTDNQGEDGKFYTFDGTNMWPYQPVVTESGNYTILPRDMAEGEPEGYIEASIMLEGTKADAWVLDEDEGGFCVVYAMNKKGGMGFYVYDTVENTMQRYTDRTEYAQPAAQQTKAPEPAQQVPEEAEPAVIEQEENELTEQGAHSNTMMLVISIMALVAAGMLIAIIVLAVKARQMKG